MSLIRKSEPVMPKGGHARSGPTPDPMALKRSRDAGEWLTLPASGCDLEVPEWPLEMASRRILEFWASEWQRPQAVIWHRDGLLMQVALYVRLLADLDAPKAMLAADLTAFMRLSSELLLSTASLRSARVRIGEVESAQQRPRARSSARGRFKVVEGGVESA